MARGGRVEALTRCNGGTRAIAHSYDAEHQLTGVSGAATATFVYDGDGNRVKTAFGATTTVYPSTVLRAGVGNHYERDNGSTVRKYYYAGGVRVAMRSGGQTYYLLGDHLGGTNVTANSSGVQISKLLYKPWGETRFSTGTTPTTWRFTGQREDATIGLYYFNARYLDPVLGRFISPDTIVPDPGNPQALNRYSYGLNRPTVLIDPTGHVAHPNCQGAGAAIARAGGGAVPCRCCCRCACTTISRSGATSRPCLAGATGMDGTPSDLGLDAARGLCGAQDRRHRARER